MIEDNGGGLEIGKHSFEEGKKKKKKDCEVDEME